MATISILWTPFFFSKRRYSSGWVHRTCIGFEAVVFTFEVMVFWSMVYGRQYTDEDITLVSRFLLCTKQIIEFGTTAEISNAGPMVAALQGSDQFTFAPIIRRAFLQSWKVNKPNFAWCLIVSSLRALSVLCIALSITCFNKLHKCNCIYCWLGCN